MGKEDMDAETRSIIENNEIFQNMTKDNIEAVLSCSQSRIKRYKAGQIIFGQEEKPNKFYIVLAGRVALVKHVSYGKKNILCELREGSIFGEDFFIDKEEEYWYDAEAVIDSEVIEISLKFFSDMCDESCMHCKSLMRNLMTAITKKEKLFLKKIYLTSSSSLFTKISIWLMNNADSQGIIKTDMGREEMANYFGVARPSLSRALMKMQDDGLIKVKKDIFHIVNIDKIKEFSE